MTNKPLLQTPIEHIDITKFDSHPIIEQMSKMSFSARDLANATSIFNGMIKDKDYSIILSLAGSTSAAGCMNLYADMIRYKMVDAIVATGAMIIDQDFHEAIGFKHYQGNQFADDKELGEQLIDRIYDTYIDEEELKITDETIYEIAKEYSNKVNNCSSRQFIQELGRWLAAGNAKKPNSLVQLAYEYGVPIFCPAFSDCSAGFGLVKLQVERESVGDIGLTIDSVADFRELTQLKMATKKAGVLIIGGGSPANFVLDTAICEEVLGHESRPFDSCIKISVADPRDGGLSGSTLHELGSWRKANTDPNSYSEVFSEVTMAIPLMISDVYHRGVSLKRKPKNYAKLFDRK